MWNLNNIMKFNKKGFSKYIFDVRITTDES